MNSDDNPTPVLGDLEGIQDLLDNSLLDEDGIHTLEQSIPELNKKVEITDNFKVSLDAYNSTETVEQQLARTNQHVSIQNEEFKVETLEQQQQDIEQIAEQEFENNQSESFDKVEMADLILKNAWIKVEMLIMENLPSQLSFAFLELLNSRVDENKLQLFEELALLDKDTFNELLEAAKIDQDF